MEPNILHSCSKRNAEPLLGKGDLNENADQTDNIDTYIRYSSWRGHIETWIVYQLGDIVSDLLLLLARVFLLHFTSRRCYNKTTTNVTSISGAGLLGKHNSQLSLPLTGGTDNATL